MKKKKLTWKFDKKENKHFSIRGLASIFQMGADPTKKPYRFLLRMPTTKLLFKKLSSAQKVANIIHNG